MIGEHPAWFTSGTVFPLRSTAAHTEQPMFTALFTSQKPECMSTEKLAAADINGRMVQKAVRRREKCEAGATDAFKVKVELHQRSAQSCF